MSDWDDFYNEMGRFRKVSEEDIERALSGDPAEDTTMEDTASALRETIGHLIGPPDETTRRSHLFALAAAIEDLSSETSQDAVSRPTQSRQTIGRRIMRRTWLIGSKAAAVGGVLAVSSLGLAYAGVDLPGSAAERAWEAVGVELPNQGDGSASDDVRAVIDASEEKDCEFGQAVSEAASAESSREGPTEDPCAGQGASAAEGSKATGEEHSAAGRAKATEKSGGSSDAGSDNAGSNDDSGRATGSDKSDGKSDTGEDDAGTGGDGGTTGGSDHAGSNDDAGKDVATDGSGNAGAGGDTASEKSGDMSNPDIPSGP